MTRELVVRTLRTATVLCALLVAWALAGPGWAVVEVVDGFVCLVAAQIVSGIAR